MYVPCRAPLRLVLLRNFVSGHARPKWARRVDTWAGFAPRGRSANPRNIGTKEDTRRKVVPSPGQSLGQGFCRKGRYGGCHPPPRDGFGAGYRPRSRHGGLAGTVLSGAWADATSE